MTKIMAISKLLQNIRRGFFDLYDPVEKHFCVFLLEKAKNVRWSEKLYTIVYPIKKSFFRWKVEFFFVENTNFCKKFCEWIFNFFNSKITYFIFFFHNVSAGGGRYRRYLTRAFGMFFFCLIQNFHIKSKIFLTYPILAFGQKFFLSKIVHAQQASHANQSSSTKIMNGENFGWSWSTMDKFEADTIVG